MKHFGVSIIEQLPKERGITRFNQITNGKMNLQMEIILINNEVY